MASASPGFIAAGAAAADWAAADGLQVLNGAVAGGEEAGGGARCRLSLLSGESGAEGWSCPGGFRHKRLSSTLSLRDGVWVRHAAGDPGTPRRIASWSEEAHALGALRARCSNLLGVRAAWFRRNRRVRATRLRPGRSAGVRHLLAGAAAMHSSVIGHGGGPYQGRRAAFNFRGLSAEPGCGVEAHSRKPEPMRPSSHRSNASPRRATPGRGAVGAHDALSARLVEQAGFDAIWAAAGLSAVRAVPDASILTMGETLEATRAMVEATRDPDHRRLRHPASATRSTSCAPSPTSRRPALPDPDRGQRLPGSLCSFYAGVARELVPAEEHARKVAAASGAAQRFVVPAIARTEALIAGWGRKRALSARVPTPTPAPTRSQIHSKHADLSELAEVAALGSRRPAGVGADDLHRRVVPRTPSTPASSS